MTAFTHTPYDGTAVPFTIGLRPLEEARWLEPDGLLLAQLAEKKALLARDERAVFQAMEGTQPAQGELLEMLLDYLPRHYPQTYHIEQGQVAVSPTGEEHQIEAYRDKPLLLAGRLVQDDLLLLQTGAQGPVLAAASLCFPSSWALADKIGKHLDAVHGPVPGYQANLAGRVNRLIMRLPPAKILWRQNWSLDEGASLHRPAPHCHDQWLAAAADPMDHIFIRVERQTLRRLPQTGFVVFTIRIYIDALASLKNHPHAPVLAKGLHGQLQVLTHEQRDYKGLTKAGPVILQALAQLF